MTHRIAIALGLLLSLSTSPACEDEPSCDVDLDEGELQDRVCEVVDLVTACLEEKWGSLDAVDDDDLEAESDACFDALDVCYVDPTAQELARDAPVDEIRGDANKCIG